MKRLMNRIGSFCQSYTYVSLGSYLSRKPLKRQRILVRSRLYIMMSKSVMTGLGGIELRTVGRKAVYATISVAILATRFENVLSWKKIAKLMIAKRRIGIKTITIVVKGYLYMFILNYAFCQFLIFTFCVLSVSYFILIYDPYFSLDGSLESS